MDIAFLVLKMALQTINQILESRYKNPSILHRVDEQREKGIGVNWVDSPALTTLVETIKKKTDEVHRQGHFRKKRAA